MCVSRNPCHASANTRSDRPRNHPEDPFASGVIAAPYLGHIVDVIAVARHTDSVRRFMRSLGSLFLAAAVAMGGFLLVGWVGRRLLRRRWRPRGA